MSFDPARASVQNFLDALLGALTRSADQAGYGWGWHFVEVTPDGSDGYRLVLETPNPLKGWDPDQVRDWTGPHRVVLTITPDGAAPAPIPVHVRLYEDEAIAEDWRLVAEYGLPDLDNPYTQKIVLPANLVRPDAMHPTVLQLRVTRALRV